MNKITCFTFGLIMGFCVSVITIWTIYHNISYHNTSNKLFQYSSYTEDPSVSLFNDDILFLNKNKSLSYSHDLLPDYNNFFDIIPKQEYDFSNELNNIDPNIIQELKREIDEKVKRIKEETDRIWEELLREIERNRTERIIT